MAYKVLHLLLFYEVIYFSFIVRKQVTSVFKDTKHLHTLFLQDLNDMVIVKELS